MENNNKKIVKKISKVLKAMYLQEAEDIDRSVAYLAMAVVKK
jgi:hypothetical protein